MRNPDKEKLDDEIDAYNIELGRCLTDSDGSTRDINFSPVSLDGFSDFLEVFLFTFSEGWCSDQDGEEYVLEKGHVLERDYFVNYVMNRERGSLVFKLDSDNSFLSFVTLLIDWSDAEIDIEISFLPRFLRDDFSVPVFLRSLNHWFELSQANEVWVVYENLELVYDPEAHFFFHHAVRMELS